MRMKRILSLVLAAVMLLPAAACSPAEKPLDSETTLPVETTVPDTTAAPETTTEAVTEPAETEPVWDPAWPKKEHADASVTRKLSLNLLSSGDANKEDADKPLVVFNAADPKYQKLHTPEIHKLADVSMKWIYDVTASWTFNVPADLSAYEAYSFWVYAPEGTVGETFYMYFGSENSATDGIDYYGKSFKMQSEGWNFFSGYLGAFSINRTPLGWDKIDKLTLTSTGWSQTNRASTVLYLDNITLHTNAKMVNTTGIALGDAFAFSVDGPRAVYDNETVEISYIDDTSVVFEESGTYWLPLSVFAAILDKNSDYNAASRTLNMTLGGRKYTFVGEKNTVVVDGKSEKLDFTVRVKGDSLFVPHTYAQSLFGYGSLYTDEMGLVILSKEPRNYDLHKELKALLNISYTTLFTRPSGEEVLADMYDNLGGDVHPRIMLTENDFDRLRGYYETDETFKKWVGELDKKYGITSTAYTESPVKWELTDGVRLLSISRKAKNKIIPFCFLYQITGREVFARRAWREVEALVNFKDWHPEHFLDTAEICYPMAIAYDWLYDYLTPEQRAKMEKATLEFGLNPGLDRYEGRTGSWGDNNWTGVCNGGLTAAALAYASALPDACTRVLDGAMRDVEKGMYTYAPDGGYLESPGYWSYGTDYLHVMMSSLDSACGTDYGLYNSPGFAESAYFTAYFETEDGAWGFHDSGSGVSDTNCLSWFGKKSGDPSVNRLRRNSVDNGVKALHVYDLMWYDPKNIVDSVKLNLDSFYTEVGSVSMRSTWENDAIFVGLHAGDNAASHGDLDIGNFVLDAAGRRFLVELGSDYYNLPAYFGASRWNYYRKRAEGQNTLVIGDVSYKKPDQNAKAVGSFTRVENNESSSIAVVDMTPAYDAVTDGKRGVLFTDNRSTVILQDEVHMSSANTVRWGVHTKGRVTINAGGRSAFIQSGTYFLYCEIVSADQSLQFTTADANSYDPAYKNSSGEYSRSGIRRLMIVTPDKVKDFEVAVVFKVVTLDDVAPALGETYQWTPMKDWKLN